MTLHGYKDLAIWEKSMSLVTAVYGATKEFPREELYGLTSQIRRSAVSVPSNIAEGRAKRSTKDFMRFLHIAYGSAAELETQLLIAGNLGYIASEKLELLLEDIGHIGRMMNGMLNSLEKKLTTVTS